MHSSSAGAIHAIDTDWLVAHPLTATDLPWPYIYMIQSPIRPLKKTHEPQVIDQSSPLVRRMLTNSLASQLTASWCMCMHACVVLIWWSMHWHRTYMTRQLQQEPRPSHRRVGMPTYVPVDKSVTPSETLFSVWERALSFLHESRLRKGHADNAGPRPHAYTGCYLIATCESRCKQSSAAAQLRPKNPARPLMPGADDRLHSTTPVQCAVRARD